MHGGRTTPRAVRRRAMQSVIWASEISVISRIHCRQSLAGPLRSRESMGKADKSATMNRMHAAARLARTTLAARLATHGFYAGQDQIMLALDRQDGQTPGQLAALLGVRPPTITKTINRLQAQGFLEKKSSETDARQANVSLTTQGREMIKAIERCVKQDGKGGVPRLRQEGPAHADQASVAHRGQSLRHAGGRASRRRRRRRIGQPAFGLDLTGERCHKRWYCRFAWQIDVVSRSGGERLLAF